MASPFDPVLDRVADAWRQWLPEPTEPAASEIPSVPSDVATSSAWRTWYNERNGITAPTSPMSRLAASTPSLYSGGVPSFQSAAAMPSFQSTASSFYGGGASPRGGMTPMSYGTSTAFPPSSLATESMQPPASTPYGPQRFVPRGSNQTAPARDNADIWSVIDQETGGDERLAKAMKLAVLLESGGDGNAVGDGGVSHGFYQINQNAHGAAITPDQSRNARSATRYMLPAFQQALQQVPAALWESDPRQAAAMTAYFAERPAVMYDSNTVAGRWDQVPLRRMSYSASNSAQSMPEDTGEILTIGQSRERWGDVTPDQFHGGLSDTDAISACGPAAAVAFARMHGRNPTLGEAVELAKSVGWDPTNGMKGVTSQVALLNKMGIAAEVTRGVDWERVRREVEAGRPVIIDTPSHYFVVEGYDPGTGSFDFGNSARVLKAAGGRSWWSPNELSSRFGANFTPRSGIYLS